MVKKLLELFSGTGSVGKVAKDLGFEVISLDLKNADINIDILHFDYKIYPVGFFDVIWSSPPCTEYSRAKTTGIRKIEYANSIVLKTIEIINYLNPKYFIIENPQTGLLKEQPFMYNLPYKDIDYCRYGMEYRKRTRLWNNIFNWIPTPLCNKDCNSMDGNKHKAVAQRMPHGKKTEWNNQPLFKQNELYVIPSLLIYELFETINNS